MQNKITKPKKSLVENDEFFYRHPEMFRPRLDEEMMDLEDGEILLDENLELKNKEDEMK
jgi:hypothetical protein